MPAGATEPAGPVGHYAYETAMEFHMRLLLAALPVALVAGCASAPINRPVEVLRYHTGPEIARGTIAVEPAIGTSTSNVEFRAFAEAVAAELTAAGYTVASSGPPPRYVATVAFRRGGRLAPDRGPAFSVGVGGTSFGRRSAVGGGVDVPVSGNKLREVVGTELSVKIAERGAAGAGVIWEGRGATEADSRLEEAAPEVASRKVARALFQGFPGESGRTITVR